MNRSKSKADYLSLYGKVVIPKKWCEDCQDFSFVIDGKLACCDKEVEIEPEAYKREAEPDTFRRTLPQRARQQQLEEQDYRCFYCERVLGTYVTRKGKLVKLQTVWDHMIPYAYAQDSSKNNFVAACQICNSIKSDLCFQTVDEARIYILNKWKEKSIY